MDKIIYIIRNALWVVMSRLLYGRNVRIIKGIPRIIANGTYFFGKEFTAGKDLRLEVVERAAVIRFGDRVKINDYFHIGAAYHISIGDDVLIGSRVTIVDHGHGQYSGGNCSVPSVPPDTRVLQGAPISIESNVWLCEGVVVLSGVTIGAGAIVGANSVVTSDIPPGCIAAGIPARVIKKYSEESGEWVRL
ncbi:DapH/DapD/GlmU-related protein [Pseudomonas sp.]|uniref:DapH/DapD/GlmU-related protein n=1 Tax=Pseudomonas sp. TaxID=306 RepID=UPI002C6A043F|nr:hypothetical protein [Pseudomonas sp.]HUE91177.1 hypothetical protein [Pseudomonas sp.]